MDEINISAVKNNDFARFNSSHKSPCVNTVGGFCRFDQDKARQQTVQVQTHMKLGGGFAPTMLRPVDTGGDQRNRAGVHHMNDTTMLC